MHTDTWIRTSRFPLEVRPEGITDHELESWERCSNRIETFATEHLNRDETFERICLPLSRSGQFLVYFSTWRKRDYRWMTVGDSEMKALRKLKDYSRRYNGTEATESLDWQEKKQRACGSLYILLCLCGCCWWYLSSGSRASKI